MSKALRKLTASISKSGTMVIFINQIRMKIGVMFGNPETTTGGNALKFYASVRLEIRRIGAIKDRDSVVGNQTRVKVVKNKMAPPFRVVDFDIMYGEGISKLGELIDLGVKATVVEKSGAWFSAEGQRIGQGRENTKQFLKDNPQLAATIEKKVKGMRVGIPTNFYWDLLDPEVEASVRTAIAVLAGLGLELAASFRATLLGLSILLRAKNSPASSKYASVPRERES